MSDRRLEQVSYAGPERRKPGRPRLAEGEETSDVRVRLPATLHDRVCLLALRRKQSVSAVVRWALERMPLV